MFRFGLSKEEIPISQSSGSSTANMLTASERTSAITELIQFNNNFQKRYDELPADFKKFNGGINSVVTLINFLQTEGVTNEAFIKGIALCYSYIKLVLKDIKIFNIGHLNELYVNLKSRFNQVFFQPSFPEKKAELFEQVKKIKEITTLIYDGIEKLSPEQQFIEHVDLYKTNITNLIKLSSNLKNGLNQACLRFSSPEESSEWPEDLKKINKVIKWVDNVIPQLKSEEITDRDFFEWADLCKKNIVQATKDIDSFLQQANLTQYEFSAILWPKVFGDIPMKANSRRHRHPRNEKPCTLQLKNRPPVVVYPCRQLAVFLTETQYDQFLILRNSNQRFQIASVGLFDLSVTKNDMAGFELICLGETLTRPLEQSGLSSSSQLPLPSSVVTNLQRFGTFSQLPPSVRVSQEQSGKFSVSSFLPRDDSDEETIINESSPKRRKMEPGGPSY